MFHLNRWVRKLQAAPVGEIRMLRLQPDDVIILQMNKRVTAEHKEALKKEFAYYLNILGLDNKVWPLEQGIELKVLRGTYLGTSPERVARIERGIKNIDTIQGKLAGLQEGQQPDIHELLNEREGNTANPPPPAGLRKPAPPPPPPRSTNTDPGIEA
ncbi:MAG: hypothetical protein WC322_04950 [Candidatus Paceibacterota bacterium]